MVVGAVAGQYAVYAWPSPDRLAQLGNGGRVDMSLIQSGSLSGGGFSVRMDPAHMPQGVIAGNGHVDLRVVVTDGDREAAWDTSVSSQNGRWNTTRAHTARLTGVDQVTLNLASETAELASDPRDKQIGQGATSVGAARKAGGQLKGSEKTLTVKRAGSGYFRRSGIVNAPTETCVTSAGTWHYGLREHFAKVFGWSGAKGTMDFDTGSSHTLGVGVDGGSGFRQSGTASIATSSGATVTGIADANVLNRVNYRDYISSCGYTTRKPMGFYAILPSGDFTYAGDTNYTTGCSYYYPGGTPWKSSVTNYTYSAGVDIGPVNVSAQSGWNTATKMTYNVTSRSKICGSSSAGWLSSSGASSAAW